METIEKRLKRASEEIELIPEYDYVVVNDEVELAVKRIKEIVDVSKMASARYVDKIRDFK